MSDGDDRRPPLESPYKLLSSYDTGDADDFFGRDEEIEAVGRMARDHRLSLLYGASGTGKTSLLRAGVLPFLGRLDRPHLPIYAEAKLNEELDAKLRQAVHEAVRGRLPVLASAGLAQQGALSHLTDLIARTYSLEEMRELSHELNIGQDRVPGGTVTGRELGLWLVDYCHRSGRLADLLRQCRQMRPGLDWLGDLPPERFALLVEYQQARQGSLIPFLSTAAALLDATLVLIVDQFEQFFLSGQQARYEFIDFLGDLHDAQAVPVHVLLSLREDWLASVDEIAQRVKALDERARRFRLLPLSRDNARDAIARPLRATPYSFEGGLIERLLDDLIPADEISVMPVQLQIVCSALFERMAAARLPRQEMRLADYEELGTAEDILSQYFSRVLADFPEQHGVIARLVLEELVTSRGTRVARSRDELAAALVLESDALGDVLERLLQVRLLRVTGGEEGREVRYELAHEYLIGDIHIGQAARERKQMEEMVRKELEDWQVQKTLISAEKMRLINDRRDLLRLPPAADELLFRSALAAGVDPDYWLGRLEDEKTRDAILLEAAAAADDALRGRAASGLIKVAPVAEEAAPLFAALVNLALTDPQDDNRNNAIGGLQLLAAGGQSQSVVAAMRRAAPSGEASIKARTTYVDLQGLLGMPVGLLPAAIRRPLLAPWLWRWTWGSLYIGVMGCIVAVFAREGIQWLLAKLFNVPDLDQSKAFSYVSFGLLGLFAGTVISEAQLKNLRKLLPSPLHGWMVATTLSWLLGFLLLAALLEDVRWPTSWADQWFGGVVPAATAALALVLIVGTTGWLILRLNGFRFSPLPLWGLSLALMIPLIAIATPLTLVSDFNALAVIVAVLYGFSLPIVAFGLWMVLLARKEPPLRPVEAASP